jgi:hypothetical protein
MSKQKSKPTAPAKPQTTPTAVAAAPSKPFIPMQVWFIVGYCVAFIGIFTSLYPTVFYTKLDDSGDNASYYILAKSLAQGTGFRSIYEAGQPLHYHFPVGYPYFLSVLMRFYSDDYSHLLFVNGLLLAASLLMFFFISHHFTKNWHIGGIAMLACAINPNLLVYSSRLLSEIPFLFSSLAAIGCFVLFLKPKTSEIDQSDEKIAENIAETSDISAPSTKNVFLSPYLYLFILFTAASIYIRTAGIVLLPTFCLVLLSQKRWTALLAFVICTVALLLPWQMRDTTGSKEGYLAQLVHENPIDNTSPLLTASAMAHRFVHNVKRYTAREIPTTIFAWTEEQNYKPIARSEYLFPCLLLFPLLLFGWYRLKAHRLLLFGLVSTTFFVVLLWPEIWFGVRFIIALIPFFILFLVNGVYHFIDELYYKFSVKRNTIWIYLIFAILSIPYTRNTYGTPPDPKQTEYANTIETLRFFVGRGDRIHLDQYYNAAKWCKDGLPKDAVVLCRKPSLFYFYAHKKTVASAELTLTDAEMLLPDSVRAQKYIAMMRKRKVTHLIIDALSFPETTKYMFPTVKAYPYMFPLMKEFKDPSTYVLELEPEKKL